MSAPLDKRITVDREVENAICRVLGAAFGVGVDEPVALTSGMVMASRVQRVQALLLRGVAAGAIDAPTEPLGELHDAVTHALKVCLAAEDTAVRAIEALADGGVEARALKGLAVSHLDHDDPAERLFADADLLIRPADHARAIELLIGAGFGRSEPPVRGWWERRFGKAIVFYPVEGSELDLHLRITGGYFGQTIDHDSMWSRPGERFDLGGHAVVALDREDRLLHACCHCALGGGSGLRAVHDVAQLVLHAGADWQTVVDRARGHGADSVVAEAIGRAWSAFSLDPGHPAAEWARDHRPSTSQAAALDAYRRAIGSDGWLPEGRSVLGALGPVDRARFLAGLAFPSRASLRARQRGRWEHLRRGLGGLSPGRDTR